MKRCIIVFVIGFFTFGVFNESCDAADKQLKALAELLAEPTLPRMKYPSEYPAEFRAPNRFVEYLEKGIREFEDPKQINLCFQILAHKLPGSAKPALLSLANEDQIDQQIRLQAVHLLTLYRDPDQLPLFESFLDHEEVDMRVAGMDAIGYLRQPQPRTGSFSPTLAANPNLYLSPLIRKNPHGVHDQKNGYDSDLISKQRVYKFPAETNARLHKHIVSKMLAAKDPAERIAAARALVEWSSDDTELRVAEWGVWIADSENNFQLVKSVLDEIPEFVTRTQNLVEELRKERMNQIMFITKPVIQITASEPMSIDITADIYRGQIWFAYPRPSDFHLLTELIYGRANQAFLTDKELTTTLERLKKIDPRAPVKFTEGHLGYPWMKSAGKFGRRMGGMGARGNNITGVGLTWENLIVTPDRNADWMKLETVPDKQKWWSDLRDVKSDWISNCEQTERFLYYDGPTLAKSPISVESSGNEITVNYERQDIKSNRESFSFDDPCQALLINVKDGKFRASHQSSFKQIDFDLKETAWLNESESIAAFEKMVGSNAGLTPDEADGLLRAWRPQFFETDGNRLLVRINQTQYDKLCPLQVRPEPTELSRVGIVLYELDEDLAANSSEEAKAKEWGKLDESALSDRQHVTEQRRVLSRARYLIEREAFGEIEICSPVVRAAINEVLMTNSMSLTRLVKRRFHPQLKKHFDIYSALFSSDSSFEHRNAFLKQFSKATLSFESETYKNQYYQRVLKWCLDMIEEGATAPPEFADAVALHIAVHHPLIDYDHEDEQALLRIVAPALDDRRLDEDKVSQSKAGLKYLLETSRIARRNDLVWKIATPLLPPETNSRLFRRILELAKNADHYVPKSIYEQKGKGRRVRLVGIAQIVAEFVEPTDVAEFEKMTLDLNSLDADSISYHYDLVVRSLRKQVSTEESLKLLDRFLVAFETENRQSYQQALSLIRKLNDENADRIANRLNKLAKTYQNDTARLRELIWMARAIPQTKSKQKFTSDYLSYGLTIADESTKGVFLSHAAHLYETASDEDQGRMRLRYVENIRGAKGTDRFTAFVMQRTIADQISSEDLTVAKSLIESVAVDDNDARFSRTKAAVIRDLENLIRRSQAASQAVD